MGRVQRQHCQCGVRSGGFNCQSHSRCPICGIDFCSNTTPSSNIYKEKNSNGGNDFGLHCNKWDTKLNPKLYGSRGDPNHITAHDKRQIKEIKSQMKSEMNDPNPLAYCKVEMSVPNLQKEAKDLMKECLAKYGTKKQTM